MKNYVNTISHIYNQSVKIKQYKDLYFSFNFQSVG